MPRWTPLPTQAEYASEEDLAASKAQTTYVQRLTAKILDNLEINVENVHLRYEDASTIAGSCSYSVFRDSYGIFVFFELCGVCGYRP